MAVWPPSRSVTDATRSRVTVSVPATSSLALILYVPGSSKENVDHGLPVGVRLDVDPLGGDVGAVGRDGDPHDTAVAAIVHLRDDADLFTDQRRVTFQTGARHPDTRFCDSCAGKRGVD